jgi:hypothetical protein
MGRTRAPRIRFMMGIVRVTRVLVAVAVFSIALQPCLACASEPGRLAAVRPADPCHEPMHQMATACPDVLGDNVVAPTVPVGILAPLPAGPELVLHPLRSLAEAMVAPVARSDGPPLWLRHASLLV